MAEGAQASKVAKAKRAIEYHVFISLLMVWASILLFLVAALSDRMRAVGRSCGRSKTLISRISMLFHTYAASNPHSRVQIDLRARRSDLTGHATQLPLPQWIPPQLTQLVETAPSGSKWLHEIKLDGFRMAARIERGRAKLLTRTGLDWTDRYPTMQTRLPPSSPPRRWRCSKRSSGFSTTIVAGSASMFQREEPSPPLTPERLAERQKLKRRRAQDSGSDRERPRRPLTEDEERLALEPGALIEQPRSKNPPDKVSSPWSSS
jgi:hypothetical protein